MNFKRGKYGVFTKNKEIFHVIFSIILIFTLIGSATASESDSDALSANNIQSTNIVYNISSDLTNDEIQSVFDNAVGGDTVKFIDKSYGNFSIIVDKKLNIVSDAGSSLTTQSTVTDLARERGINCSFGFYLTNAASGTVIKGLTFTGGSDYEIIAEGANQISISGNTISGGNKAGISISNSSYNIVRNNSVSNSAADGILLSNVNRSSVDSNRIYSNADNGLSMTDTVLVNVTGNMICNNGNDGILMENAKADRILSNNISSNGVSGIRMEGFTIRNTIMYNNITGNVVNIYADSTSTSDVITQNTLMYAVKKKVEGVSDDNLGSAILFADNYKTASGGSMEFYHNTIGFNAQWDAKSTMEHPSVNIGSNWYFDNDGNYGLGHICPMVFGKALSADSFKHFSIGFSKSGNGIAGQLYSGSQAAGAGAFTIDNVNINGKDYGSVTVGTDGKIKMDNVDVPAGSVITITVNGHSFTVTSTESSDESANESEGSPKSESKSSASQTSTAARSSVNGNGTGSGSSGISGSGSGNSNFTGSGISAGEDSGDTSNGGTGDSGENGAGSSAEMKSGDAFEILSKQLASAAENNQLLGILAVALIMFIVLLGYRRRNDRLEFGDYDDYSL